MITRKRDHLMRSVAMNIDAENRVDRNDTRVVMKFAHVWTLT